MRLWCFLAWFILQYQKDNQLYFKLVTKNGDATYLLSRMYKNPSYKSLQPAAVIAIRDLIHTEGRSHRFLAMMARQITKTESQTSGTDIPWTALMSSHICFTSHG
jgi:hypothetical protein